LASGSVRIRKAIDLLDQGDVDRARNVLALLLGTLL
jgi:hypothetical protein